MCLTPLVQQTKRCSASESCPPLLPVRHVNASFRLPRAEDSRRAHLAADRGALPIPAAESERPCDPSGDASRRHGHFTSEPRAARFAQHCTMFAAHWSWVLRGRRMHAA